jgi:hypothetical protein
MAINRPPRLSPPCVLSYAEGVWTAKSIMGSALKFCANPIYKKGDMRAEPYLKALLNDLKACLAEAYPEERSRPRLQLVGAIKSPIKDGDKTVNTEGFLLSEKNPEYTGHWVIRAYAMEKDGRPPVVDRNSLPILEQSQVYSGCIVRVSLQAYYSPRNKTVTLGYCGLMKWDDGQRIGAARPSVEQMFGGVEADDPAFYDPPDELSTGNSTSKAPGIDFFAPQEPPDDIPL